MTSWGQVDTNRKPMGFLPMLLVTVVALGFALQTQAGRINPDHATYLQLDCASYVAAINNHPRYGAKMFFEGKAPGYTQIASSQIATGAEGDVAAYHGVHVAVFHLGAWHDSDPAHNGAGLSHYDPKDPWFHGAVKIFRRIQ